MNCAATRFNTLEDCRAAAHAISRSIRCLVQDRMRPVLYHGTRYPHQILTGNELRWPYVGLPTISFSRLPEASTYWPSWPGMMMRDKGPFSSWIAVASRNVTSWNARTPNMMTASQKLRKSYGVGMRRPVRRR